jgi:hypothetical protein
VSAPVQGFLKLLATLLVPTVTVGGLAYIQRGLWWAIIGGVAGLLAGLWAVRDTWEVIKLRRRSGPL